jgi:hypothetical protein
MPKPAPPNVGASGKGTCAKQAGASSPKHHFAIPESPMVPRPGGPPEIPVREPARFPTSVKITELSVPPKTGRLVVIGPKAPPGSWSESRWKLPSSVTDADPAPPMVRIWKWGGQ